MGSPKTLKYIKKACAKLPDDVKSKIGYSEGATILPDINENGQIVGRDVGYLAGLHGGETQMANANPPPPLRNGKQVKGYMIVLIQESRLIDGL